MNKISWDEIIKLAKESNVKQYDLVGNKNMLKQCLYNIQENFKVQSAQDLVDKLELISWKANLKYMSTSNGNSTEIFISSDMFYIEIKIEMASAKIDTVKIAHNNGEPTFSEDLWKALKNNQFKEFLVHLNGINSLYQISTDKKQRAKIYMAINSLENDLLELYKLQSAITDPYMLITRAPLGYVVARHGGLPMQLVFFLTPYDLVNLQEKTLNNISFENLSKMNIGMKVVLNIKAAEDGNVHKLQTSPVLSLITSPEGKTLPHFAGLNNQNSSVLNAFFCLEFDYANGFIISLPLLKKIQSITGITFPSYSDSCNTPDFGNRIGSLTSHLIRRHLKKYQGTMDHHLEKGCCSFHFYVKILAGRSDSGRTLMQKYSFAIDEAKGNGGDEVLMATTIYTIPFTHPTHIPQILMVLRQQALMNSLLETCFRLHGANPDEEYADGDRYDTWSYDIFLDSPDCINVTYANEESKYVVRIEIDVSDMAGIKTRLFTTSPNPGDQLLDLTAKMDAIAQKSVSLPCTLKLFSKHIPAILRSATQSETLASKAYPSAGDLVPLTERLEKSLISRLSRDTRGVGENLTPRVAQQLPVRPCGRETAIANSAVVTKEAHPVPKHINSQGTPNLTNLLPKPVPKKSEGAIENFWPRSIVAASERPSSCPTTALLQPKLKQVAKKNGPGLVQAKAQSGSPKMVGGDLVKSQQQQQHHLKMLGKKRKRSPPMLHGLPMDLAAMSPKGKAKFRGGTYVSTNPSAASLPPLKKISIKELLNNNIINSSSSSPGLSTNSFDVSREGGVYGNQSTTTGGLEHKFKVQARPYLAHKKLQSPPLPSFLTSPNTSVRGVSLSSLPKIPKLTSQSTGPSTKVATSVVVCAPAQGSFNKINPAVAPGTPVPSVPGKIELPAVLHDSSTPLASATLPCRTDIFPSPDLFRRLAKNLGLKDTPTAVSPDPGPSVVPKLKFKFNDDRVETPESQTGPGTNDPKQLMSSAPGPAPKPAVRKSSLLAVIDKLKSANSAPDHVIGAVPAALGFGKEVLDFGNTGAAPNRSTDDNSGTSYLEEEESMEESSSRSTEDQSLSDPTTPDKLGPQPGIKMTIIKRTNSDGSQEIVSSVFKPNPKSKALSLSSSPSPCSTFPPSSSSSASPGSTLITPIIPAHTPSTSCPPFSSPTSLEMYPFACGSMGDVDDRQYPPATGLPPSSFFYARPAMPPVSMDQDDRQDQLGLPKDIIGLKTQPAQGGLDKVNQPGDNNPRDYHHPSAAANHVIGISAVQPGPLNRTLALDSVGHTASPRVIDDDLMDEALMSSSLN